MKILKDTGLTERYWLLEQASNGNLRVLIIWALIVIMLMTDTDKRMLLTGNENEGDDNWNR